VDVPANDSTETERDVGAADDVRSVAKGEIDWADARALDRLMQAQDAGVGLNAAPAGGLDRSCESLPYISDERKSGQRQRTSRNLADKGAGFIKDVDEGMCGSQMQRYAGALVIPRHEENGHPVPGDRDEALHGLLDQARTHLAAKEQIAPMDDGVDEAVHGRFEGALEVGEKVMNPAAALDPGAGRLVEADVGIGHQQQARNGYRFSYGGIVWRAQHVDNALDFAGHVVNENSQRRRNPGKPFYTSAFPKRPRTNRPTRAASDGCWL